jgi:hypothetical protein
MNQEKHGAAAEQSWLMLSAFASVGVCSVDVTLIDLDGQKCSFHPAQKLEAVRLWLPNRIEAAIRLQQNVIVRPRGATAELVQLDDLSGTGLERVSDAAFLIVTTSPENHQAWVAIRECPPDFARRLRLGSGADPSASGAVRIAGSINFKRRYAPDYPLVTVRKAVPRRMVAAKELEAIGLVAPPEVRPMTAPARVSPSGRARVWPSYERCLQNAPVAHHSDRPDVSRADFTFCLLAIDWGWSVADTYTRLLEKSGKAQQSGPAYARLTVERAGAVVQRRRGKNSDEVVRPLTDCRYAYIGALCKPD